MAGKKLNDKQEREIVMKLVNGAHYSALAKEYNVSKTTIANVKKNHPEFEQKLTDKKRENARAILDYMDTMKAPVCDILGKMLTWIGDDDKLEKASLNQIAVAMGVLIDKFTASEQSAPNTAVPNNLFDALAGCVREDDFDDVSGIQSPTETGDHLVEE